MNILVVGISLFNDELRRRGHSVFHFSDRPYPVENCSAFPYFDPEHLTEAPARLREIVDKNNIEALILLDDSKPVVHLGIENLGIQKIWYSIDTHLHHGWHRYFGMAFDTVCIAQKKWHDEFRHLANRQWLPLYFWSDSEYIPWEKRTIPISFVGNLNRELNPGRIALFDGLRKRGMPVAVHSGDFRTVYRQSKVVVNQCVNDDVNFRFFEAPGCGAVLVNQPLSHSMTELLVPGEEYVLCKSDDVNGFAEAISWCFDHEKDCGDISKRGYERVHREHLLTHRVDQIERILKGGRQRVEAPGLPTAGSMASTFMECARVDYPEYLRSFFLQKAREFSLPLLESDWAKIVLARSEMELDHVSAAQAYLAAIEDAPNHPLVRHDYYAARMVMALLKSKVSEARRMLESAQLEFPASIELKRIGDALRDIPR
jgi:hypothetical protein